MQDTGRLPWEPGATPLMLAPMQGLTNRALRALFCDRYWPDIVFTEYVRVQSGAAKPISDTDRHEVSSGESKTPLVVQLIGSDPGALTRAAETVQSLGTFHLNINLGCPYGRMSGNTAGGALLNNPEPLARLLGALRPVIRGSFSVKLRAGINSPDEIFSLLPLFEAHDIDFLIIHPRTVRQRYSGRADHGITAEAIKKTRLPVIANGDIFTTEDAGRILDQTNAAGLMLGRGAISDPLLFQRIRGNHRPVSTGQERIRELQGYLQELLPRYQDIFCGEQQTLAKIKEVITLIQCPESEKHLKKLKKSVTIKNFSFLLATMTET